MTIHSIFVIGAGTMGNGIAQVAATSGYNVTCMDALPVALDQARKTIAASTAKLVEKGRLSAAQEKAAAGIRFVGELEGLGEADLVIEAASENLDVKLQIFREIDKAARADAILASNTSSISITKLAAITSRPERVIGMHFMNPVPIMRLVEVIRGLATSNETAATILEVCSRLGKEAWEANDSPGFISNRILCPMINEAIFALQENVGTPESIDAVMKLGMNHPMGPLALADLIGLDTVYFIANAMYAELKDPQFVAPTLLGKMVTAGWLGRKTGKGFYDYK